MLNILPKRVHALYLKFVHKSFLSGPVEDHLAEPSLPKYGIKHIYQYESSGILTSTALLALWLSHSTAWMAWDVEVLDDSKHAWVGLLVLIILLALLVLLIGSLKLSPSEWAGLSPNSSQHSSTLCTFTVPWPEFMFARYHNNEWALNRTTMNSGGGVVLQFQSLLHDSLLATAHVESCALFRKKDGTVKAASAGYQVRLL